MTRARIHRAIDKFHGNLLTGETAARREVAQAYAATKRTALQRIDKLESMIIEAGDKASPSWAFQQRRLRALMDAMTTDQAQSAAVAAERLKKAQLTFAEMAAPAQQRLVMDTAPKRILAQASFVQPSMAPVKSMVGYLADGTPVHDVLVKHAGEYAADMRSTLQTGLAVGDPGRRIGAALRDITDGSAWSMMRIVRTESMRAYREATTNWYDANSDVVQGWMWLTAEDERTCPFCLMMSGTKHLAAERMESHPCCRCSQLPVTVGFAEITGLAPKVETSAGMVKLPTGDDWLRDQPEHTQNLVMGIGAAQAWRDGDITLDDLYRRTHDPDWGTVYRRVPLKELLPDKYGTAADIAG